MNKPQYLSEIIFNSSSGKDAYPFSADVFKKDFHLKLKSAVTFLVGENGTGKSTLLEGIAYECGFNLLGGGVNNRYGEDFQENIFEGSLRLSWSKKTAKGFFMRAESLFDFANHLEDMVEDKNAYSAYGGRSLHEQSHGEAFLSLFQNRFNQGIFILDEPEAALSPTRQLSFLALLHQLVMTNKTQFIIATHSPIILSYPDAQIFTTDGGEISKTEYTETSHFQITRDFLNHRERFLKNLLE